MAKTTLPEISNWLKSNDNCTFHIFSFSDSVEKKRTMGILDTFVSNHPNYRISTDENSATLVKKNV
jgi:hypothetical protein